MDELSAVALVCTLKKSPAESSSDRLARQVLAEFAQHEVRGEIVRVVDYDVLPGITADEGEGDQWPQIREKILAADILLVSTPTWLGHMSSVAQRMLERLDAELSNTDDRGRPAMFGKVATAAVVGNEDGAHKIIADLFQALDDIGFSLPGQGGTYWNGEAMSGVDYLDLDSVPKAVAGTNATLARNAAHLARLLRAEPYPA
ncbi:flavodoxin family protein [Nocardia cyriacigeorgica]|uniref:flavodoxin family protein n=1 Tax=Nocardia cyriacigeorgica TaxID=135487 RepID=UPI001893ED0C|nr:NAD(P)H-dependent oxidoreductase [Nocardia cyriacigeorgica]MBF6454513.1 NAD(P)H-dependent oxidoreductase [Nocardia cyriacigeorgica]MBF6478774.1 NAD(P)H-dependent oxidoreductase [Nocardia cyriacigeorgica]MBF6552407.1 NAD(P)H-dependent oxidoreductase [Nocardia cyriacigeorgica]